MAWAIFDRAFDWSRPRSKFSFHAEPSAEPQSWIHDFIDAAVAAGAARRATVTAFTRPARHHRATKEQPHGLRDYSEFPRDGA